MAEKSLKIRIQHKIDTEENWKNSKLILYPGEIAFSSDRDYAYKIGDGVNLWSNLSYATPCIKELSTNVYDYDVDTAIAANDTKTLDNSYTVGANELEISVSGVLLYNGVQYEEVGTSGTASTTIKFLHNISAGSQLHIVIRKIVTTRTSSNTSTADDTYYVSTTVSNKNSYTVTYESNNYLNIAISSSTFALSFTPADSGIFSKKYINLSTSVNTQVTYTGSVFANSGNAPTWGSTGHNLLLEAIFISGRVVLNVIDNDQITSNS